MDAKEYNQSVDTYSDNIYRFMLKNTRDSDLAKDIVQDSFIRLWDNKEKVDAQKVKSYLFTTAYHLFIDHTRKEKKKTTMDAVAPQEYAHNDQYTDLQEILHEAIAQLPDKQRSVVMLRDYEGYSYQEIANITKLSESQVKVYIYRARVFLKKYLVSMDIVA